jgi:hypothetical protein
MKLLETLKSSLEKFKFGQSEKSEKIKSKSITMITKSNVDDDDMFLFI